MTTIDPEAANDQFDAAQTRLSDSIRTCADNLREVMTLLGTPSIRDPFHHDRWDYVASRRTGRSGPTEVKNMTLYFENEALSKWEGEYFPEEDSELAKTMAKFGNLAKDKDKGKKGRR